jgi:hypothetical protein
MATTAAGAAQQCSDDRSAEFLTPDEVVARWQGRIKAKTLSNWRGMKPSPGPSFLRLGNRALYRRSVIEKYEREHGYDSTQDYGRM